jgi:ABC-2 type transport system ATP-binding protein
VNFPVVSISRLSKHYPLPLRRQRIVAVSDLSLEIAAGEIYGLLGPNGSGKSTTLKVLLGLATPTHGKTMIFGVDSRDYRSHRSVGFLPENPYFYRFLTADETLRFYGRICGLRGRKLQARITELLSLVGLEEARHRRVAEYSKGMLQRIGLAQALVQDPQLVVLDEPTAGVDPAGSHQIRDLILERRAWQNHILTSICLLAEVRSRRNHVRGSMVSEEPERTGHHWRPDGILIQGAPSDLTEKIAALANALCVKLLEARKPRVTLERVFLEATRQPK